MLHRHNTGLISPRTLNVIFLLIFILILGPATARAEQGLPRLRAGETAASWLSEFRGGLSWHDPAWLGGREGGVAINGELLFVTPMPRHWAESLPRPLRWLAEARPHLGFNANAAGNTSAGYFGITGSMVLARDVFRRGDAIRFDVFGGGAVHDGLRNTRLTERKALGSSLLFRGGGEISYQFTPRYSVGLFVDHVSNGGTARVNEGLNTVGLRFGIGF